MANNDVNVTMNAATSQAQAAWLQFVGVVDRATNKLEALTAAGGRGGRETALGLKGAEAAAGGFAATLLQIVKVGGPLALMGQLAFTIRSELEKVAALTKQSQDFGLRRADMLARLAQPLGATRTDAAGRPFGVEQVERHLARRSAATGIPQEAILRAVGPMLSADTSGAGDEIIDLAYDIAQYEPRLALPSAEEEMKRTGMGILELKKAARMKGQPLSNQALITGFFNLYQQSRADELSAFAETQIPAIAGMIADRPQESIEQLAAIFATAEQVGVDTTGRRTATNVPIFRADLLKAVSTHAPELRDLPFNELRRRLRDATPADGGVFRARAQLLGQYQPGITDEEVLALKEKEGSITGEARVRGINRAMLLKGSQVDLLINEAERANADLFAPSRIAATQAAQERTNRSGALFEVQQERARLQMEELGHLARRREAQRTNLIETSFRVLKDTEAVRVLPQTGAEMLEYAVKHFGSSDPERIAAAARDSAAVMNAKLGQQLAETTDPTEKQTLRARLAQVAGLAREVDLQLGQFRVQREEDRQAERALLPAPSPTTLERHPEQLIRTPLRFAPERRAAQEALRSEVAQILTSEGTSPAETRRVAGSVQVREGESSADALARLLRDYDRPHSPGPKFGTLSPQEQDQERASHAARRRGLARVRAILEPPPADRRAEMQELIAATEAPPGPAEATPGAALGSGPEMGAELPPGRAAAAAAGDPAVRAELQEQTAALKRLVEIFERSGMAPAGAADARVVLPPLLPLVQPLPGRGR